MKNILNKYYLAFMAVILFGNVYSQTQISGSVSDAESMSSIPGVNVIIDGTNIGTVTDFDGNFSINTSQDLPLTVRSSLHNRHHPSQHFYKYFSHI